MDAVKFLKERHRMCETSTSCSECPLGPERGMSGVCSYQLLKNERSEKDVEIVEKWSKENPVITNAMKFQEVFQEVFGEPTEYAKDVSPCFVFGWLECADDKTCSECKEEFWNAEYKKPEVKK